jgi:NAD(P)-dependent dehydrogenase (short-subunit alcohol dehydrogenase family)
VLALDVTDEASMVAAVEAIAVSRGQVDVLVNCAGFELAVAAFTEALRLELAGFGVKVVLVEPTAARTRLNANTPATPSASWPAACSCCAAGCPRPRSTHSSAVSSRSLIRKQVPARPVSKEHERELAA